MKNDLKFDIKTISILVGLLVALIIAISISFYFLFIIPSQEQVRLDLLKKEQSLREDEIRKKEFAEEEKKRAEQIAQEEKELNLSSCLLDAELAYSTQWSSMCIIWKAEVDKDWKDCRNSPFSWQTDEENKQYCIKYMPDYKEDEYGSCLLPTSKSSTIEDRKKEAKNECYLRYS